MPAVASVRIDPASVPVPAADGPAAASKDFADPTGALSAGVWRSPPRRIEVDYRKDEFCCLIEGEVRLTDADGRTEVYRAGDAFVVPAGFKGVWEMPVPVTKFYVLHVPRAAG